jgi:ChrR Cupin-like domain
LALAKWEEKLSWGQFARDVDIHWIYREGGDGAAAALIRFQQGGRVPLHEHRGHEHIFVLSGSQTDENGRLAAGSLMVNAPGIASSARRAASSWRFTQDQCGFSTTPSSRCHERAVLADGGRTGGPRPRSFFVELPLEPTSLSKLLIKRRYWQGRLDSNHRPSGPEPLY